jgi:hypothetical protein
VFSECGVKQALILTTIELKVDQEGYQREIYRL